MVRLIESSSAQLRLQEAQAFVDRQARLGDVYLVGASRGAVDDLARSIAARRGATMGLQRFSVTQLASHLATPLLARRGLAPLTGLGSEAVAARATFEAMRDRELAYFAPVAGTPGFPRALAHTLQEVRLAGVEADRLAERPLGGRDLSTLLRRVDEQFDEARATDRAALFSVAAAALADTSSGLGVRRSAVLLLDVPIDSRIEQQFVRALIDACGGDILITVPFGDIATLGRLQALGIDPEVLERKDDSDLSALRGHVFADRRPPDREPKGDVRFFSAPGEGRECLEIARRIVQEARQGVPFDEMAVFLRAPQRYLGLLEHAFARAGVPAWFDRGTRRPHPAGRAFLAILSCACERLSARRFAEYLSLAQVPRLEDRRRPEFVAPDEDELSSGMRGAERSTENEILNPNENDDPPGPLSPLPDDEAIVAGTLRAPWKWETLIVESAVIGGDSRRWHRRLDGLANELRLQRDHVRDDDPESPKAALLDRDLRNLGHLRAFALPVIDVLASWPREATWGEWIERFAALAPMVLRQPERIDRALAQLRPMAAIGPVSLEQARGVIADRLQMLEVEPPPRRYGRVFVGSPHQARGRTFRVVFLAGLAERLFPQRPHEDPMLLDKEMREPLGAGLALQDDRARTERLLLRLAVGAATERLWLSYPRIEVAESRPRVPSFYALDVMRAITGRIPKPQQLQDSAAVEGDARLAWPAPPRAADALDDLEHDLAVLRDLLQVEPRSLVLGHAHYLLQLNECLKRSVSARWARARSTWTPHDGLTRATGTTGPLLERQRLGARPYSLSALQKFAACPYQFLLSAIHRLEPPREIEPLQKLDPLTRGSIFHEAQARFFRAMQREGQLPVDAAAMPRALATIDAIVAQVAADYYEKLAPAIDRVWKEEIADLARDLRVWVRRMAAAADQNGKAADSTEWVPAYFEFAFGLPHDTGRDPASVPDPVAIDGRFVLRGSVDLIERHTASGDLRITDHKTGRKRTNEKTVIGGGSVLQPVLYSMVVEQALGTRVVGGRLYYCTSAGGFDDSTQVRLDDATRRIGAEALEIVDRAIELGFLPAAPAERACTWCDFRPVCGPDEPRRVALKSADKLGDLEMLRGRP
jgi:ATP-dependent helicase/nuclease subunit B